VSIYRLLQNAAFEPEVIQAMSLAFEDAPKTLVPGANDSADVILLTLRYGSLSYSRLKASSKIFCASGSVDFARQ